MRGMRMRHGASEVLESALEWVQPGAVGTLLLTPRDEEASHLGTVVEADLGAAGLAARLVARVPADVAAALDSTRVWVTARLDEGRLVVYRGLARRDARGEELLDLTGVAAPVVERRRALVRAAARLPGQLVVRGCDGTSSDSCPVSTVDVSAAGCRLQLAGDAPLPAPGAEADIVIELPGALVQAGAEITRTDATNGQVVVRFRSLQAADAERLHRHVLASL